jgi:hypothetical protein
LAVLVNGDKTLKYVISEDDQTARDVSFVELMLPDIIILLLFDPKLAVTLLAVTTGASLAMIVMRTEAVEVKPTGFETVKFT